jgi:hypothetical protein
MTKRRIILVLGVSGSIALLAVAALSQERDSRRISDLPDLERLRSMTEAQREREAAKRKKQRELEARQRARESKKKLEEHRKRVQRRKEAQEGPAETKRELLGAKRALGVTQEQWKLIRPKLEKVRDLRGRAHSTVGLLLSSSSASAAGSAQGPSVPAWQWNVSWKDKAPGELSEAQRTANRLMALVDRQKVAPGALRRTMDALRKARRDEAEIKKQLAQARAELREGLTPRQEAGLTLLGWL